MSSIVSFKFFSTLAVLASFASAADNQIMKYNDRVYQAINNLPVPRLEMPSSAAQLASLPSRVDNTTNQYFRPIFNQVGNSCMIASNMGYIMTYEKNILDQTSANVPQNQIAYRYIFDFVNNGVDAFTNGWDALTLEKEIGAASVADFGDSTDFTHWMTGYDRYYRAMKTRFTGYYRISGTDKSALLQMKQYLFDANTGRSPGGLIAAGGYVGNGLVISSLPQGTPDAGKSIITQFANLDGGHAMTWVGYDDSVRIDINGDGKYTNDIDINGDGIVDIRDWEIGAFIVANSWGDSWENNGKIYVMYRLAGFDEGAQGGMSGWRDVMQFETVQPKLTAKFSLSSASRGSLSIGVGISSDTSSITPQHLKSFQALTNSGGDYPMQGGYTHGDETIEMGLDISSLLDSIPASNTYKLFLMVQNSGTQSATVNNFSVIRYNFSADSIEYFSDFPQTDVSSQVFVPVVVKEPEVTTRATQSPQTAGLRLIPSTGIFSIPEKWFGGSLNIFDLKGRQLKTMPTLTTSLVTLPKQTGIGLIILKKNGSSVSLKYVTQ